MSSLLTHNSRLFLVCPSDCIEKDLRNSHNGKAFFYTALGACFEWDKATQESLIELIDAQTIDQVIFVTKKDNLFYKNAFESQQPYTYRVERALFQTIKGMPSIREKKFMQSHCLAVHHLLAQESRLLSTTFLGKKLCDDKILVESLIYDEEHQKFYSLNKLQQQLSFASTITLN